jgi:haloacetate dehalogenase
MSADLLPGARRSEVAVNGVRFTLHRGQPVRKRRTTPVLLLHGLPQTAAAWRSLIPELAKDRTVLAPDLKGLGASEHRQPYDIETLVDELAALAAHEVDQSLDVVGHGIGGGLAVELAARRPGLVRRLVVISSAYGWLWGARRWAQAALRVPAIPELLGPVGSGGVPAFLRYGWRASTPLEPRFVKHYSRAYRHPARTDALIAYARAAAMLRRRTPEVEAALVVWGAADPLLPLALAEQVRSDLGPQADLVEVPEAGHFPVEETPEIVVPVIAEFLRRTDAGSASGGAPSASGAGTA